MGSLNPENDPKQELDDSGYVQEDTAAKEVQAEEIKSSPNLLDLSDDVLLHILQYCSPIDLKAVGYTCSRLGTLVLDRTLWQRVEARDVPTGKRRMQWLLTHALSAHTTALKLSGYAREAKGCLGYMSGPREEPPMQAPPLCPIPDDRLPWHLLDRPVPDEPGPRLFRLSAQALPRYGGGFPYWPEQMSGGDGAGAARGMHHQEHTGNACPGPQVTLTSAALTRLTQLCFNLTELALDYVVIDCKVTKISMFPQSLRVLSLKGTKCFNLEKSFLYKIHDHLIYLEDLDVSLCDWIEPACMLPLSKLPRLQRLLMRDCFKLTEFVAYASLATRYGFKALKILDLRGSPVGDSEVSALGWVPLLEQLYLSPADGGRHADHAHFSRDPPPVHTELLPWEDEEPDYYTCKYAEEQWILDEAAQRAQAAPRFDGTACGSPYESIRRCESERNCRRSFASRAQDIPVSMDRLGSSMGYVIPNTTRSTMNMYAGNDDGNQAGSSRNMEGNSQNIEGDENMEVNGQNMEVNDQNMEANGQNMDDNNQNMEGNGQNVDGNSQNMEGNSQNVDGNGENMESNIQNMESKSQNIKRNSQNIEDNSQNMEGSNEKPEDNNLQEEEKSRSVEEKDEIEAKNEVDNKHDEKDSQNKGPNNGESKKEGYIDDTGKTGRGKRKQEVAANVVVKRSKDESIVENCDVSNVKASCSLEAVSCSFEVVSCSKNEEICSNNDVAPKIEVVLGKNEPSSAQNSDSYSNDGMSNSQINVKLLKNEPSPSRNGPVKIEPTSSNIEANLLKTEANSSKPEACRSKTEAKSSKAETNRSYSSKSNLNQWDSDSSDDEPLANELKKIKNAQTKDRATKASRKYYDDNEPSKAKESLGEFKKRLLSGQRSSEDNSNTPNKKSYIDSKSIKEPDGDPKPQNNDEDDSPQSKRSRMINDDIDSDPNNKDDEDDDDDSDDERPLKRSKLTKDVSTETLDNNVSKVRRKIEGLYSYIQTATKEIQTDPPRSGASTSQAASSSGSSSQPSASNESVEAHEPARFVRFRHNQPPVVVEGCRNQDAEGAGDDNHNVQNNNDVQQPDWNNVAEEPQANRPAAVIVPGNPEPGRAGDAADPPRHRILYVNVGRRRHAMYQIAMPDAGPAPFAAALNLVFSSPSAPRLEYTSLVTDAAIRRFGRADGENVNYIQIGPMGIAPAPYDDPHARPNRSNLRILSVTGFRHITNYSLTHLATAAPHLQFVDFSGTRVTESGVENFRNIRPDCKVRYGPIDTPKEDCGRPHSR